MRCLRKGTCNAKSCGIVSVITGPVIIVILGMYLLTSQFAWTIPWTSHSEAFNYIKLRRFHESVTQEYLNSNSPVYSVNVSAANYTKLLSKDAVAPPAVKKESNRTAVVIVTYHRSGSSLLGEAFNNHPDVMYFFEPIIMVPEFRRFDMVPWFARRTSVHNKMIGKGVDIIKRLSTCDYSDVVKLSKSYKQQKWKSWPNYLARSNALTKVAGCYHPLDIGRIGLCGNKTVLLSLDVINDVCKQHRVHVIKTVRLHVADLAPLIKEGYNLKIIYLTRDPRGVIASRKKIGIEKVSHSRAFGLCNDMLANWKSAKSAGIPASNLMIIRYEDFVQNIESKTREMFDFVGLRDDAHVHKFLDNVAHGQANLVNLTKVKADYSVFRVDSKNHIDKWKSVLTPIELRTIVEPACKEYIESLGFKTQFDIRTWNFRHLQP